MAESCVQRLLPTNDNVNDRISCNEVDGNKMAQINEEEENNNISVWHQGHQKNNVDVDDANDTYQIKESEKVSLMNILSSASLLDLTSCFVRYAVSSSSVLEHLRLLWRVHLPHMSLQQLTRLLNVVTNPIIPTGRLTQQKYYNSLNGLS